MRAQENITGDMLHEDRDNCKVLQLYMTTRTPQSLEAVNLSKAHLPKLVLETNLRYHDASLRQQRCL